MGLTAIPIRETLGAWADPKFSEVHNYPWAYAGVLGGGAVVNAQEGDNKDSVPGSKLWDLF